MFNDDNGRQSIRRVAVIGSGVAGLTAGLQLQAADLDVTLFEKSRGPGGRLASKRAAPVNGIEAYVDIGAQFFTLRNPRFRALLETHAGPQDFAEWPACLRYQASNDEWQPFREASRYVGVPRMTALSRALSKNLSIRMGVRIHQLQHTASGAWQLVDVNGTGQGTFDAVIMAIPPAQARDLLNNSAQPELAAMLGRADGQMQACWAVAGYFPESLRLDYQGMQPQCKILQWAGNNSSKPGRNDDGEWWVLHARPDWSDEHLDDPPARVVETLLSRFATIAGITAVPEQTIVHRWLYARSSAIAGPGHHWFEQQRIGVVGDWLHGGRVEGAFDSADSLIERWRADGILARA